LATPFAVCLFLFLVMSSSLPSGDRGLIGCDGIEHQGIVAGLLENDSDVLADRRPAETDRVAGSPARSRLAVMFVECLVNLHRRDPMPFGYDVVVIAPLVILAVPDDRGVHGGTVEEGAFPL